MRPSSILVPIGLGIPLSALALPQPRFNVPRVPNVTPTTGSPTALLYVRGPGFTAPSNESCDISHVTMPENAQALPAVSPGLELVLIAIGTGTQNYTCASPTAKPTQNGAVATLRKGNCAVAGGGTDDPAPIGTHFFADSTTPEFDVIGFGKTLLKKAADTPAPTPSKNVALLKLQTQAEGTTSTVKEIYRLATQGGVAPADCSDHQPGSVVTVEYTAQYWFFA